MSLLRIRKFKMRTLTHLLLLIPFFPVQSIQMMASNSRTWTTVYDTIAVLRLIYAALAIAVFIIKRKKPNPLTWGIIAAEVMIFIACCINESITFRFSITMCMATIGFAMLCQELDENNEKAFLNANTVFFGLLCFFGVVSIFLFPNGFNHSPQKQFAIWFLGSKNAPYYYYAQFLFLLCYKAVVNNRPIPRRTVLYDSVFIVTTVICRSSNGTLMLLIILVGLVALIFKSTLRKLLKPRNIIILVVILALMIPVFTRGTFDWFFRLIGRTSDFSMRTYIWDSAIEMIKDNLVFGAGKDGDLVFFGRQTHAHNFYLDVAAKYGILALTIIVISIIIILSIVRKAKNREIVYICSLFMLTLLIHSMFDVVSMYYLIISLHFIHQSIKMDGYKSNSTIKLISSCTLF